MTTSMIRVYAARLVKAMGAVSLAAVLVFGSAGLAQAGGGGGSFGGGFGGGMSDRMDDADEMMADGWMGALQNVASLFYIGVRGKGFFLLDEAEDVNAELGNYAAPMRDATSGALVDTATDFTDLLNGSETEPTELTGGFGIALGYDVPIDLPGGGLRVEFEYAYQIYENEACFPNIAEGQDNITLTEEDDGLPTVAGTDAATRDARRAAALRGFSRLVPNQCESANNPVHGFLGNIFYDIDLANAFDMMGVDGSAISGLAFNIGVGFGYQLVDAETEQVTVAAMSKLPAFNPSDSNTEITFAGPGTTATDPITAGATELAESGFLLPVYGGFSYSLEDMANLPVVIEATYRYDAIAPDGVGAHTFGGGLRYHF